MTCFCLCERSEAISREGEVLQSIYFIALVVGYFAYAQYDVLFPYVILNDSEESHRRTEQTYTLSLWSWDISLTLNMTFVWLPPSGEVSATPTIGDKHFGKPPSREIASLRSQRQRIYFSL